MDSRRSHLCEYDEKWLRSSLGRLCKDDPTRMVEAASQHAPNSCKTMHLFHNGDSSAPINVRMYWTARFYDLARASSRTGLSATPKGNFASGVASSWFRMNSCVAIQPISGGGKGSSPTGHSSQMQRPAYN
ncbi:hypothetical protein DOTSEDRAFT_71261 [Dothistroma septosporum NZE10]|uniref:Uncharacterized protein n=1 Tax=Dothistroma septosporum (strain NZE10 / CBS 128990) TaxID=675120 RepID=N1PRC5_DOTSN|nr:hypothetical protein DOTSEDRAFT_71261 [Dothistroma septosporum NZE10]